MAKVCDFRYHKETRTLNVYISGTNALFGTDKTQLAVGKAVAYDSNSQAATATFRAMQETVGYVYGEELKKPTQAELDGGNPIPPRLGGNQGDCPCSIHRKLKFQIFTGKCTD